MEGRMAKVMGGETATFVASVQEIGNSGRVSQDGNVSALLMCGNQDLIITMNPETAKRLASGILDAAERSERGERDDK
jgi:hypothetical protein